MAKKKQEYSTESVDEMVERLKKSYESADHAEGDDADTEADDEAFAKMLVEMFGNQGKSKPVAPKSTDLYSAKDFMPDEDDEEDLPVEQPEQDSEQEPLEELEVEFEEELEEEPEEEPLEELEVEFEEELEEELEEEPEEDMEQDLEEEPEEDLDEFFDELLQEDFADEIADAEVIKEQIKEQAQAQIIEQLKQEQEMVATEPASEEVLEDELPWFVDDELDEEDAAEIAEYEALVAQDELEQLIDEDDEEIDEDEAFFEDEWAQEETDEDEEFFEDEIVEEETAEDEEFFEDEIVEEETVEDEEFFEDEFVEEEIVEDEEFFADEFVEEEITEEYIEPAQAEPEQEPAQQEDYVDMLLDSLVEWKQSVAAVKAQMKADHSADIPAAPQEAEPEALSASEIAAQADAGETDGEPEAELVWDDSLTQNVPAYPENDPQQGRVASPEQKLADATFQGVRFDEKDIHLMAALGYEQEVKGKVGSARVRNATLSHKHKSLGQGTDNPLCFAWRGKEYMDASDEADIKQAYRREKPWVIVRLAVCVLALFTLIALDNAYLLGFLQGSVPAIVTTPIYPLVAALAVFVVAAVSWRRLFEGVRSMFARVHSLYSVPALLIASTLIYDVGLAFLTDHSYMMFNSIPVLALTLCTVADVLDLYNQERNFKIVRTGKPRYGVEKVADAAVQSRLPVKGGEQAQKPRVGAYRVRNLSFVGGYFRRTGAGVERSVALSVIYGVILVCAIASAAASYIATGQGMSALSAFMVCLNAAMPLSMLLFGAIPAFVVGKTLERQGCAVIGAGAPEEYKDVKALVFDAGQMFTAYGSSQITVRGDSDIGTYMDKTRVLLRALGGTLADIAGEQQENDPEEVKIEIMSVSENGMTLYMNGITCVMMGDYDYLAARDVRLPRRDMETNYKKRKNSAVVYLAFDGQFRVGYSVDYQLRREFLLRAKQLQAESIDPVIVTYDPSINQQTLRDRAADTGIAVERQREYEGASGQMMLDCGVIATRAPEDVLLPLLACRKLRRVRILGLVLRFTYLALTAALIVLLSVLGHIMYAWPLLLLLYQLLWLTAIPVVCTGLLGELRKTK